MKKIIATLSFFFLTLSIFSTDVKYSDTTSDLSTDLFNLNDSRSFLSDTETQDKVGIKGWILNYPDFGIKDYTVYDVMEEANGITFTMGSNKSKLKISLIKKIEYNDFINHINNIVKTIGIGEEFVDKRGYGTIKINQADISFGFEDNVLVLFRFVKLYLNINRLRYSTLDLTRLSEYEASFFYYMKEKAFTYNISIPKVKNKTGIGDSFNGWSYYLENLFFTFEKEFYKNNNDIHLIIYNTQMNLDKVWIVPDRQPGNMSMGVMIQGAYYDSKANLKFLVNGMARDIGHPDWLFKPFGVIFAGGMWGEADFGYLFERLKTSQSLGLLNLLNFGVTMQFGFNVGVPVFKNEAVNGKKMLSFDNEILKLGYEMFFDINLNYKNSYILNFQPLFVLYLFPTSPVRLDFFVGGGITYNYNETDNKLTDDKTSFCAGMRIAFDYIFKKVPLRKEIKSKSE